MSLLWVSMVPLGHINPGAHGAHGAYECPWESYGVQCGCPWCPWCPWFPWCPWCSNVAKPPGKKLCTRLNTGPLPCWSKTLSPDNPLDSWELSLLWGTYTVALFLYCLYWVLPCSIISICLSSHTVFMKFLPVVSTFDFKHRGHSGHIQTPGRPRGYQGHLQAPGTHTNTKDRYRH